MDRLIYTALNALNVNGDRQVVQAQNLANQSVPGFRRDFPSVTTMQQLGQGAGESPRVFQVPGTTRGFSENSGAITATGMELDVAIADRGYFYVMPQNGNPALSRRGDMHRDADGTLRNGAEDVMLGPDMAPIQLPPYSTLHISDIGEIFIQPLDQPGAEPVLAGVLATVIPPDGMDLAKGDDGQIRPVSGAMPAPDQRAEVLAGMLESSNVNPIEELLSSMEQQRQFERGIRMVMTAQELDESGSRVMQAPEG